MCNHLFGMYTHNEDASLMKINGECVEEDIEYINNVCGRGLELFEYCPKCGCDLKPTDDYTFLKENL